ncbi:Retrovirus-related Pol polyprotein from transposon RE2 [Sesamum angolense]|uniref:Retrovirus-related Pol polyprotein from transposon RE2 n=1 Tax=Sesamum angolense TaxID=2727404 RepID=A0AAE2BLD7_9LAMI|nr:Retrovirus-related Pol polyprotein from transposon RE2 [Sesamum angolense]
MPDTSVDMKGVFGDTTSPAFSEAIRKELLKLMKGKMVQDPLQVNFAHTTDDFTAYISLQNHTSDSSPIPTPTPIPDVESIVHLSSVLPPSTPDSVPESLDTMPAIVHTPVVPAPSVPSTRLHRLITKPAWLQDYVCNKSSFPSNPCIPKMFSPVQRLFLANVAAIQEPKSFAEANQNDDWRKAMQLELHALKQNETWDLTTLLEGNKTIGSHWVYKVKILPDGKVDRYKARLVAKGYTQMKDVKDYLARLFYKGSRMLALSLLHCHREFSLMMLVVPSFLRLTDIGD